MNADAPRMPGGSDAKRTWRGRLSQMLERRLPALTQRAKPQALPVELNRQRIYILPTRFGMAFGLMLMVMMVGALNYANNAALLLTCLLGAACVGSMLGTFRNLDRLQLRQIRAGTAFAGEPIPLRLEFAAENRERMAIELLAGHQELALSITSGTASVTWPLPTTQRGWLPIPGLRIRSTWPLGLFRAWSWIKPSQLVLVYPRPEAHGPSPADGQADHARPVHEGDELASLRNYRGGDALKLIAWKASARHHELLSREFEHPSIEHTWRLTWRATHGLEPEARIARLTRWVDEAHAAGRTWSLDLAAESLGPATGSEHFHRCMAALAQLP